MIHNFTGECDNPGIILGNSVQDVQFRNIAIQTADTNKVIGNNK